MYNFLCPAAFYYCPAACAFFMVPCPIKCQAAYGADPPADFEEAHIPEIVGEYYQPPITVEYNPPEISYKEQEMPEMITHPYMGMGHGYEYDGFGGGWPGYKEPGFSEVEDRR